MPDVVIENPVLNSPHDKRVGTLTAARSQATTVYARMMWNYDPLVEHLKDSGPRYPLGGLAALVDLVRTVEPLLRATRP